MTRAKKTTTVVTTEEPHDVEESDAPGGFERVEEVDEVQRILDTFGAGASIAIYEITNAGERRFRRMADPTYWSEQWMQSVLGEGRYLVQIRDASHKIRGQRTMLIGPAEDGAPPEPEKDNAPAHSFDFNPPAVGETAENLQLRLLIEESKSNREMMLTLMSQMLANNNGNHRSSAQEMTELLANMKTILAPSTSEKSLTPESIISILRTGISLGKTGDLDVREGGVVGIIKDVAPIVGDVVKGLVMARGQTPPAPGPQQNPPAQIEGVDPRAVDLLRHGIQYLKSKAAAGKPIDSYVNFVADNLDDPQWNPLMKFIGAPYEEIAKLDPELMLPAYRPWFEALFDGIKQVVTEVNDGSDEDADPIGTDGNAVNP